MAVYAKPMRKPEAMPSRIYVANAGSGCRARDIFQASMFNGVVILHRGGGSGGGEGFTHAAMARKSGVYTYCPVVSGLLGGDSLFRAKS